MKDYSVVSRSCSFGAGQILRLSPEQVAARPHLLDCTEDAGIYIARAPLEFKQGEIVGLDGDVNKKALLSLEEIAENENAVKASAAAKVLAEDAGIDLEDVVGTGRDGSITKTDVENHIAALKESSLSSEEEGDTP